MRKLTLTTCLILSMSTIMAAAADPAGLDQLATNDRSGGLPVFEPLGDDPLYTEASSDEVSIGHIAPICVKLPLDLQNRVVSFEITGSVTLSLTRAECEYHKNFLKNNPHITVIIVDTPTTAVDTPTTAVETPQKFVKPDFKLPSFESLPASPTAPTAQPLPGNIHTHVDPNTST